MNINPIGYQAKTVNGNDYQKSNLGKTATLATVAALDVALNTIPKIKNSELMKTYGLQGSIKSLEGILNKQLSKNAKIAFAIASFALDFFVALGIGHAIDKSINRKRAYKADMQ